MPGDIIILHKCNKNYGHMMYGSWDMVHNGRTGRRKNWHIEVGANVEFSKIEIPNSYARDDYEQKVNQQQSGKSSPLLS